MDLPEMYSRWIANAQRELREAEGFAAFYNRRVEELRSQIHEFEKHRPQPPGA